MATKKSSKKKSFLTLAVEGKKLTVPVSFVTLAGSRAGKSPVAWKTKCAIHNQYLNKPTICTACGPDVEVVEVLKETAGVTLPAKVADSLKVTKRDTVKLLRVMEKSALGSELVADEFVHLMPKTSVVLPVDDGSRDWQQRYAALHQMLGQDRVAILEVYARGRMYYAVMRASIRGCFVLHELFKPEDVSQVPVVDLVALPENVAAAFDASGEAMAEGVVLDEGLLNTDPTREAVERAVMAAAAGEEIDVEELEAETVEEDLLSLA